MGNACIGHAGDGGPANQATIDPPQAVAVGPDGSIYIAESAWNDVRRINPSGIITTFAGKPNTVGGYSGDGGAATKADLHDPEGLAVNSAGRVYISDHQNYAVRMVDTNGTITTFAGTGSSWGSSADGLPATQAVLGYRRGWRWTRATTYILPTAAVSGRSAGGSSRPLPTQAGSRPGLPGRAGSFISPTPTWKRLTRWLAAPCPKSPGTGRPVTRETVGPHRAAELNSPVGIVADAAGNVFIADTGNNRVRVVSAGTITTYAGTGSLLMPNGTAASGAQITMAQKVTMDSRAATTSQRNPSTSSVTSTRTAV